MTHYALYRRALDLPVDEDSIRVLLEAYIDQLGGLHKADQLVAIYSAELESGDRERAYAKYLEREYFLTNVTTTFWLSSARLVLVASEAEDLSFEGKQHALEQAEEQGLDARKIANIVSCKVADIIDVSYPVEKPSSRTDEHANAQSDVESIVHDQGNAHPIPCVSQGTTRRCQPTHKGHQPVGGMAVVYRRHIRRRRQIGQQVHPLLPE